MNDPFMWIGSVHAQVPLILTSPHSGERIPPEAPWLNSLPAEVLLTDIDRHVDELYGVAAQDLKLPLLATHIHRYCADLNRYPGDVDARSVMGSPNPAGSFPHGFHWTRTTQGIELMKSPISETQHLALVSRYHDAFHEEFQRKIGEMRTSMRKSTIYHLDCHSMPSRGRGAHRDPGQSRAEVVISDFEGQSALREFKDLLQAAFQDHGFQTAYNWPYLGGRITQRYGRPHQEQPHQTLQIELNRSLYLDETTRKKLPAFENLQSRLKAVLADIVAALSGHC